MAEVAIYIPTVTMPPTHDICIPQGTAKPAKNPLLHIRITGRGGPPSSTQHQSSNGQPWDTEAVAEAHQ